MDGPSTGTDDTMNLHTVAINHMDGRDRSFWKLDLKPTHI